MDLTKLQTDLTNTLATNSPFSLQIRNYMYNWMKVPGNTFQDGLFKYINDETDYLIELYSGGEPPEDQQQQILSNLQTFIQDSKSIAEMTPNHNVSDIFTAQQSKILKDKYKILMVKMQNKIQSEGPSISQYPSSSKKANSDEKAKGLSTGAVVGIVVTGGIALLGLGYLLFGGKKGK